MVAVDVDFAQRRCSSARFTPHWTCSNKAGEPGERYRVMIVDGGFAAELQETQRTD